MPETPDIDLDLGSPPAIPGESLVRLDLSEANQRRIAAGEPIVLDSRSPAYIAQKRMARAAQISNGRPLPPPLAGSPTPEFIYGEKPRPWSEQLSRQLELKPDTSTDQQLNAFNEWSRRFSTWVESQPDFTPAMRAGHTAKINRTRSEIESGRSLGEKAEEIGQNVKTSFKALAQGATMAGSNVALTGPNTEEGRELGTVAGIKTLQILESLETDTSRFISPEIDPTKFSELEGRGFTINQIEGIEDAGEFSVPGAKRIDRREKLDKSLSDFKTALDEGTFPDSPDEFVPWLKQQNQIILDEAAAYNGDAEKGVVSYGSKDRKFEDPEMAALLSDYTKTRNDGVFAEITRRMTRSAEREILDRDLEQVVDEAQGPIRGFRAALPEEDFQAALDAATDPVEAGSNVISAALTGGTGKAVLTAGRAAAGRAIRNSAIDVAVEAGTETFQAFTDDPRADLGKAAADGALVGLAFQLTGAAAGAIPRAVQNRQIANEAIESEARIEGQRSALDEQFAQITESTPPIDETQETAQPGTESVDPTVTQDIPEPGPEAADAQDAGEIPAPPPEGIPAGRGPEITTQDQEGGPVGTPDVATNEAVAADPIATSEIDAGFGETVIAPDSDPTGLPNEQTGLSVEQAETDTETTQDNENSRFFGGVPLTPRLTPTTKDAQLKGAASNTNILRRWGRAVMKKRGDAPQFARGLFERREGRQAAFEKTVENSASKLQANQKRIQKRTGLTEDQVNDGVQAVLTGDTSPATSAFYSSLTNPEQEAIKESRQLIDTLSNIAIANRVISDRMADTFEENLGSYLTRSYMMFDPDVEWGMEHLSPKVKSDFIDLLRAADPSLTRDQAELRGIEILDPEKGFSFFTGASDSGRINVGSLRKKKDLDPRYRAALGEVKNPAKNIAISGRNITQLLNQNLLQREVAQAGLDLGLFSTTQSPEYSTEIFPDKWSIHTDAEGGVESVRRQPDPTIAGFRGVNGERIFATQADARQMRQLFDLGNESQNPLTLLWKAFRGTLATATGISKIAQVLFNPGIYVTAFSGGPVMEIANGRFFTGARFGQSLRTLAGMNRKRKQGKTTLITPEFVETLRTKKASEWDGKFTDQQLEIVATEAGILNQNVLMQDLAYSGTVAKASPLGKALGKAADNLVNETAAGDFIRAGSGVMKNALQGLASWYAIGDNAGKMSGLMSETRTLAKAFPDMTIGEVLDRAAENIKETTPTYDRVPTVLREGSILGLGVNQYVSFLSEIFRNTLNSFRLGGQEITSGNPVLQRSGAARLLSISAVLGASSSQGINFLLGKMFDDAPDDEDRERLMKYFTPPWYRDESVGVPYYNRDTGEVVFLENSYTIPQAAVTAMVNGLIRDVKEDGDVLQAVLDNVVMPFTGDNLPKTATIEAVNGVDSFGRRIWYPEQAFHEKMDASLRYVFDKAFKTGFGKTVEQTKKAYKNHQSTWGQIYSEEEVAANILLPIRTKTYNIRAQFPKKASQLISEYKQSGDPLSSEEKRQESAAVADPEALEKAGELTTRIEEARRKEFRGFIEASLKLGIPRETILNGLKNKAGNYGNVPGELRAEIKDLLPKIPLVKRRG